MASSPHLLRQQVEPATYLGWSLEGTRFEFGRRNFASANGESLPAPMPVKIETGRACQHADTPRPRTKLIPILLRGPRSASRSWPGKGLWKPWMPQKDLNRNLKGPQMSLELLSYSAQRCGVLRKADRLLQVSRAAGGNWHLGANRSFLVAEERVSVEARRSAFAKDCPDCHVAPLGHAGDLRRPPARRSLGAA